MMNRIGLLLGVLVLAAAWPVWTGVAQDDEGLVSGAALVRDVRVGQDKGRTRIVLEFDGKVPDRLATYRWFTLPKPARVVLDFADVSFVTPPSMVVLPEGSLVTGMRAGRFRPHTVRMVLDLAKPGKVNVFSIPVRGDKGARVVLDVVPLKAGEKPTDVPPPVDVVDNGSAPVLKPQRIEDEPAPVVPRQVVQEIKQKRGRVVVVLDPGHGGVDPGACGRRVQLCENLLTLKMAKLVRDKLENDRIQVVMTRDTNVFIPLPDRPRVAQRHNADLFVSLHADIHPSDRDVKGATVYMVSGKASDREAARLADSENEGDVLAGVALANETPEVRNILVSLVQRETLNGSAYLGQSILREMGVVTEVRKKDVLFAGFRVLKAPDVPSVLVEMGYLSNPTEERQLNDPGFRDQLAEAIARGIRRYVEGHVHY